jgi:hypothetical protein
MNEHLVLYYSGRILQNSATFFTLKADVTSYKIINILVKMINWLTYRDEFDFSSSSQTFDLCVSSLFNMSFCL